MENNKEEGWKKQIRERWHIRSVNMAQEVTDYSEVEELIANWWIKLLASSHKEARDELLKELEGKIMSMYSFLIKNQEFTEIKNSNGNYINREGVLSLLSSYKDQ